MEDNMNVKMNVRIKKITTFVGKMIILAANGALLEILFSWEQHRHIH